MGGLSFKAFEVEVFENECLIPINTKNNIELRNSAHWPRLEIEDVD